MSAFAVTDDGHVLARFDDAEASILLSLSEQFAELVAGAGDPAAALDPAVARLFPDAYRDDPQASAEFSRYTRSDLAAVKADAAATVRSALGGDESAHLESAGIGEAGHPVGARAESGGTDVLLDAADGWSWLRHLADLRLTIAARLGVVEDPHAFDDDPDADDLSEEDLLARSVFDWLGYVQELLITALEEAATGPSSPSA